MKGKLILSATFLALVTHSLGSVAQSWELNNCTATGPTGPSQGDCSTAYTGTSLDGDITVAGGIQQWVVPTTGTYRIDTSGASGGDSIAGENGTFTGGSGATVTGEFELTAGEQLNILVGQQGTTPPTQPSNSPLAGGGGGSFVWKVAGNELLLAAAGGGGAGDGYTSTLDPNGADGVVAATGSLPANLSNACVSLATAGEGWTTAFYTCGGSHAGGGAGWNSNGLINADTCDSAGTNAFSPLNGGTGGNGNNDLEPETGPGGFGGGGGSATECGSTGGGGGGGYTGGAGLGCSVDNCGPGGGGGGSFNGGANPQGLDGANTGHGSVTLTLVAVGSQSSAAPEAVPALPYWSLMILATLLGLSGSLQQRTRRSR